MTPQRRYTARRGGVYPLVLIVCAAGAAAGLTGLTIRQATDNRSAAIGELTSARLLARSGIEASLQLIDENEAWRTDFGVDETLSYALSPGTVDVLITDETDGDLSDRETDSYQLLSDASVGDAVAKLKVSVEYALSEFRSRALNLAPVGFWPLDESTLTSTASTLVGSQNGGYSMNTVPNNEPGYDGRTAPRMDTTSTLAFIPHHDDLLITDGTMTCWFNCSGDISGDQTVVAKDITGDTGSGSLRIYVTSDKLWLIARLENGLSGAIDLWVTGIRAGEWYNIAATWGDGGFQVYVNGEWATGSKATRVGLDANTHNITIGAWHNGSSIQDPLNGSVRDVVFFDRALTSDEIGALVIPNDPGSFSINPDTWAWVID